MQSLVTETRFVAIAVSLTDEKLIVALEDSRSITVPLAWYPRLMHGSTTERSNWQLLGDGYAIDWPDLDEHIGIEALLAGRRNGESERSMNRWRAARPA
ncbi:MAG: DUF2442 domain-containing protein [Blastocatellia bacterium]